MILLAFNFPIFMATIYFYTHIKTKSGIWAVLYEQKTSENDNDLIFKMIIFSCIIKVNGIYSEK